MDWSEINFIIPKEIILHIVSFMDDRSKRQMRLANTTWFNFINYSNFTLYFTRIDKLPEITDRLSKYNKPIGVKFIKSFVTKMEQWILYLPKLTNLTSLSLHATDYNEVSLDNWMKLTALSNLESWPATYYCPDLVLAKLLNLTELIVQDNHSWTLFKELPKFTNLLSLNVSHSSTVQDLDLSILPDKLTKLEISALVSGRGVSKLTNLKSFSYRQRQTAALEPFPFTQLSKLKTLNLHQDLLDVAHFPRNITELNIGGMNITPDCQAGLAHLDKLKTINVGINSVPDTCHSYLTAMTALEDVTLWPSVDWRVTDPSQNTTGAYLSYLRSDKVTSLTLGVTSFIKSLEHLSNLTTVENLFLYEESAAQTEIDYGGIGRMTNLTTLTAYVSTDRPSLLCLTDLVSLKSLLVDTSDVDNITFDDRFILTRLTNLEQLTLNGCTRATVESLTVCTNLHGIQLPTIFSGIDYSFLDTMRLTSLSVKSNIEENESFWNILPKLTKLCSLELREAISEENIVSLTSLQHLTYLHVLVWEQKFKAEHVTLLTTVQRLFLYLKEAKGYWKQEDLFEKMPYLTYVSV